MQISESLPYQSPTKRAQDFMGYMENFIYGPMQIRVYFRSVWLKVGSQFSREFFHINFQQYMRTVYGTHGNS